MAFFALGLASSMAGAHATAVDGRALLEKRCGGCHGVTAEAKSRVKSAPNLWDTLRTYPEDRLAFELAEGIGSRHRAMPQVQFTPDEVWAVQAYLANE